MGCTHSKKKRVPKKETHSRTVLAPEKLYTPQAEPPPIPSETVSKQENLVSATVAQPPNFEETVKEEKIKAVAASQNTDTFQWPSAYEVKRKEEPIQEGPLSPNHLAQWAAKDKYAFLENRIQLKNKRKKESIEDHEEDDTLFELPTRMPNVDFSTERLY